MQLLLLSPARALDSFLVAFESCLPCLVPSVRFRLQPTIFATQINLVAPGMLLVIAKCVP